MKSDYSQEGEHTLDDFNIYYSDLNEGAQQRLMAAIGILDPREINWDIDLLPLAVYPIPFNDEM